MGEVYAALDRLTGTQVALKRVLHSPQELLIDSATTTTDSGDARRTLANEFRVLTSLRHPHIINVLDYGFDSQGFPYYTMTLLKTPRTITEAAPALSFQARVTAFVQTLQAVAYLHRRGVLHHDLKPANILIDEQGAVKVLDFGLATHEHILSSNGTLWYMPPEIIQQQPPASIQSDLYSVGIVAYELFTGVYPFNCTIPDKLIEQLLFEVPDSQPIPLPLRPIIIRLLMKNPADRYPDAEAVLAELAEISGGAITVEDASVRESFLQAARFVGRERELNLLTRQLDQIFIQPARNRNDEQAAPRGAAFLIGGESGVGKSRLLDELQTYALTNGALVLRGQCIAEGGEPFQMWRDVVRRLLVEQEVNDIQAATLGEIIPDIDDLLGRKIALLPTLGVRSAQSRLVDAILGLFQHQTKPTLLILEDLQWGLESIIPLRRLLSLCSKLPLLIVGSYRSEEAPILPMQLPEMKQIMLSRLTMDEISALCQAMIGINGTHETLVEYLHRQSEGNVLFLIEVIRALADDVGNLSSIGLKPLPEQVVSGGIERIIARRLQSLPSEAAPTLRLAAVAGRNIDERLLRWLIGEDAERWLQAGMNAAILEVVDAQWRFAHDRLRDAILSTIPKAELAEYHRLVAEGLEALYPNTDALAGTLYDHWRAANNAEKEAYYAVMVTAQRWRLGIVNEAYQMLQQALQLDPQDGTLRLELYRLAGAIHYDLGKPQLSAEYYAACCQLARALKQPAVEGAALEGLGSAAYAASDFEIALRWYEESLNLRRRLNDLQGVASALHQISVLQRFRGRYSESRIALEESMSVRRRISDLRGLGDSLYQLSVHTRNQGEYAQAVTYAQEGIHLRRRIGDSRGLADDLNNLGICYMLMRDYQQASDAIMESFRLRENSDNQRGMASCQNALGDLYMLQGQHGAAIRAFNTSLSVWQMSNDPWNTANSHASIGCVQALAGEVLTARYHLQEALQIAERIPALFIVLKALIGWAQLALLEGDNGQAALLLGAVEQHPAMTAQLRQVYFEPILELLDMTLYAAEYALGKDTDLASVTKLDFIHTAM